MSWTQERRRSYMKSWKRRHPHYNRDWHRRYRGTQSLVVGRPYSYQAAWKRIVRLFLGDF